MRDTDSIVALAFRWDVPSYDVPAEDLASYKKSVSPVFKEARKSAKPERCLICGEEMPKFCVSHTVPRYCLKEIAADGKLLTNAAIMGGNVIENEVGVGQAATFKQVCRKCDSEYFKLYETPETLLEPLSSQVLGQIAAKNLLREISKARFEIELKAALGEMAAPMLDALITSRVIDAAENEKAFKTALRVGKTPRPSNTFHLMFHMVLPYTALLPFNR